MNGLNIVFSFITALIFGLTIGGMVGLLNISAGIICGALIMFMSFYGLLNQTWERKPQAMNRRFNDNPY